MSTSTNYVPLQPPYKVIKFKRKIGVQIGMYVLTLVDGNPLKIETRRYPVVVDEKKVRPQGNKGFVADASCEFVVWDNVNPDRVFELCRLGDEMDWDNFIRIVWDDHARMGIREELHTQLIFDKLLYYLGSIQILTPDLYTIHLHIEDIDGQPGMVCSSRNDALALSIEWTDDDEELTLRTVSAILNYLLILSPNRSTSYWHFIYETDDERLRSLSERLNADRRATKFAGTIKGMFVVRAINHYEDKQPQQAHQASIHEDPEAEKRHRLERSNTIICTHDESGKLVVDLLVLFNFIKTHFADHVSRKYEWYALRRFLLQHKLLNNTFNNNMFEEQMNHPDWFGSLKITCSASEMNIYNFLNSLEPSQWTDLWRSKVEQTKASQSSVNKIYNRYQDLVVHYPDYKSSMFISPGM